MHWPKVFHRRSGFMSTAGSGMAVLHMLVFDDLYYADPSTFNARSIRGSTSPSTSLMTNLERIWTRLVAERTKSEVTRVAKSIRYTGPRTIEHVDHHSDGRGARSIHNTMRCRSPFASSWLPNSRRNS
jgi:hypothetical protein